MTRADDAAMRAEVLATVGRPRSCKTVTTSGLSILVDGVEVLRCLTRDQAAVCRWLRSLLRRWSDAAAWRRGRTRAARARA